MIMGLNDTRGKVFLAAFQVLKFDYFALSLDG